MKKWTAIILIIALLVITVVIASAVPGMHKTFQIERIIIKKELSN